MMLARSDIRAYVGSLTGSADPLAVDSDAGGEAACYLNERVREYHDSGLGLRRDWKSRWWTACMHSELDTVWSAGPIQ